MTELLDALGAVLGAKGLITEPAELAPHVTDFRGRRTGVAQAVALPASTVEAAEVLRIAQAHCVPVFPLGGNTGLCYGAVPEAVAGHGAGIIVGLRRMARLRDLDRAANVMTVDAGMTLAGVHVHAEGASRQFPLHLGSEGTAQIGGLIATNAGGTGVLRYGPMRDQIGGLEVVLPDGRVLRELDALRKNNTGYDLKHLFIGSEGTLGLITGAALRLQPAIRGRAHAWAAVTQPSAALELLSRLQDRCGNMIEAFELLNAAEVACVLARIPGTRCPFSAPPPWSVMIELGTADPAADAAGSLQSALEEVLAAAIEDALVPDAMIAQNVAQAEAIWHFRHSITEAHKAAGVGLVHDTAVRTSSVPEFLTAAEAMICREFPQASVLVVSHLGDGNVHFTVMFPFEVWKALEASDRMTRAVEHAVHDIAIGFGGTISAEHGIGRKLTTELARLGDPVRLDTMRQIKSAIDPDNLMNPGALFPNPSAVNGDFVTSSATLLERG
jgi:FAD/FMN-containing dehydrogenase